MNNIIYSVIYLHIAVGSCYMRSHIEFPERWIQLPATISSKNIIHGYLKCTRILPRPKKGEQILSDATWFCVLSDTFSHFELTYKANNWGSARNLTKLCD
jgi:hypothetical protein